MAQFINQKEQLVTEAIDGGLLLGSQARLDGYPHIKVVLRSELDGSKVALVSGGGSGHEPAHGAFVGRGMLSAAVCGEVFASPSVDAVLAAILAVTGDAGCLLIVKNYTGDRLNFGLAAERAKAQGKRVEMVVVADDIALPDIAQPRGVAGTLFVHKIAGYLAERGESLESVASAAREVAASAVSYGASLSSCDVPGAEAEQRIAAGKVELGLGIHGEPGVKTETFTDAKSLCDTVMTALLASTESSEHLMLLNNLGATTPLEMSVLANMILNGQSASSIKGVIGPAPLMTALNMHGFSVSLLPAKAEWVEAMQSEVEPLPWPEMQQPSTVSVIGMPAGLERAAPVASDNAERRQFMERSCDTFLAMEADLNALDAKTGDGDTGSTLAAAARALKARLSEFPLADETALLRTIGDELGTSMGGSSGVLMAIFFASAADASAKGSALPEALNAGLSRMQDYGGAGRGHRTMIDALAPALEVLSRGGALQEAADAARAGADLTATMGIAKAGRSAYVPEQSLQGVVDPGAEGVARYFASLL